MVAEVITIPWWLIAAGLIWIVLAALLAVLIVVLVMQRSLKTGFVQKREWWRG